MCAVPESSSTPRGVSVVIPTHNRAPILPRALDGVLGQELPPAEIIVVDDGSTDGTSSVLASYERRHPDLLRVIRQANAGAPAARNAGIREAQQPFIALLDSDDVWRPEKLRRQMEVFAHDPALGFCFTAIRTGPGEAAGDLILPEWEDDPIFTLDRLLLGCCIVTSTVVATRRLLLDIGGFDTSLRLGDDYDLFLRVALRGNRIAYVSEPLTVMGGDVAGISARAANVNRSYEEVLKRYLDGAALPGQLARRRRTYWSLRYLNNASHSLEQGNHPDAVIALLQAFLVRPLSSRPGWIPMLGRGLRGLVTGRSD